MQPYNYSVQTTPIGQDSFAAAFNGFNQGAKISEAQRQQQAQQQMSMDLAEAAQSGDPRKVSELMVKYPSMAKNLSNAHTALSEDARRSKVEQASQIYSALLSGSPDIAESHALSLAEAHKNDGDEQGAKSLGDLAKIIKLHPESAQMSMAAYIASADPKSFAENFHKLGQDRREQELQGSKVSQENSKATSAAVKARFAESEAVADLENKGWQTRKLANDIDVSRENTRIAAINADLSKEKNDIARQVLQAKLDAAKIKRDETVRTKVSDLGSARSSMDNMLNTADRFLAVDADTIGSIAGPISSKTPTLSQDSADAEELIATLSSQAFLAQVPMMKGLGALSVSEGEKLQSSLQNLSLRQSPKRLIENVREAQRLIIKGRENLAQKYGVPDSIPDTPAAAGTVTPDQVDYWINKYAPGVE